MTDTLTPPTGAVVLRARDVKQDDTILVDGRWRQVVGVPSTLADRTALPLRGTGRTVVDAYTLIAAHTNV